MEQKELTYVAPEVEVIEVEQGFNGSTNPYEQEPPR